MKVVITATCTRDKISTDVVRLVIDPDKPTIHRDSHVLEVQAEDALVQEPGDATTAVGLLESWTHREDP